MPAMPIPRIVGIDYGTKRVGIALSDPLRLFAQADGTYSEEDALARLDDISKDLGIETIVVGWPLDLSGEEGAATRVVRPFVNRLKNQFPDISVVTWDERFSSEKARQALVDAGVRRKNRRRRGRVDSAAAAVILQEYLDEAPSH